MSVFSVNMNHRSFHWQLTALCFVLGLLLAAAAHTTTSLSRRGNANSRVGFAFDRRTAEKVNDLEKEIGKRNKRITELENQLAKNNDSEESMQKLNTELQAMKFLAGLSDSTGPGIQVTLTDSTKQPALPIAQFKQSNLIHDSNILDVINELKAAGAEAISINGKRIVASTSIRCVGPVVQINSIPIAPPYLISAIGDTETMVGALNMTDGVLAEIRRYDPGMVKIEKKPSLTITAFAGSTQTRFAKPVKSAGSDKDKEKK